MYQISGDYRKYLSSSYSNKGTANLLPIVKKVGNKYIVDVWELPFDLKNGSYKFNRSITPNISNVQIYYELLNKNEILDIGYKKFSEYQYNFVYVDNIGFMIVPYFDGKLFNLDIRRDLDEIKGTANLKNLDISKLEDLDIKIILEEKGEVEKIEELVIFSMPKPSIPQRIRY